MTIDIGKAIHFLLNKAYHEEFEIIDNYNQHTRGLLHRMALRKRNY